MHRPRLALAPLLALLLLTPAARAVVFVPVNLSIDSASLQIRCNGTILAEVAGSLPVSESFNDACQRGSTTGNVVVSIASGELQIEIETAQFPLEDPSALFIQGELEGLAFDVPDFGASVTPIFFTLTRVSSTLSGVDNSLSLIQVADGYSSAALGAVNNTGQVNLDLNSGDEQSERVDFIPGDSVVYSSSFAGGGGYIFGFQATDPGTAMATYRLKAAAVRPTPLPEPSQALQLAVGAAMLFALSKRRRASDPPSLA